ncbi:MAG: DUF5647 family protein, partial [candidate division NC10 bacterium]
LFRRNHELFEMFMLEALNDPALTAQIPNGASVIFLPENDPELLAANLELARVKRQQGEQVVFVRVKLVPEMRTIFVPRLTVEPALAA